MEANNVLDGAKIALFGGKERRRHQYSKIVEDLGGTLDYYPYCERNLKAIAKKADTVFIMASAFNHNDFGKIKKYANNLVILKQHGLDSFYNYVINSVKEKTK